jgi:hypothetical protein
MYLILLNALIEAARRKGDRPVQTGNDVADILEEAKRIHLHRVAEGAEKRSTIGDLADDDGPSVYDLSSVGLQTR